MLRTAVCGCGQLSVGIEGEPAFHGLCSCLECQRASGSAFNYSGYWPKSAVRGIGGKSTVWRRSSDAGRWVDTHFCPVCGSSVFAYAEFAPDMINIAIGNFADPGFPPPAYAVHNVHKHPWVAVPPGCDSHDTQPDADPA
jgi:hypothetical protein